MPMPWYERVLSLIKFDCATSLPARMTWRSVDGVVVLSELAKLKDDSPFVNRSSRSGDDVLSDLSARDDLASGSG